MVFRKPETPGEYLRSGLLVNAALIGITVWASSGYGSFSAHLLDLIERQEPLLVFRLQQSALAFSWVGIAAVLIAANIELIFAKVLQREIPLLLRKVQHLCVGIMFLGITLLLFGNQLVNPRWEKTFTDAGYSRCETWLLPGAKAFFNHAWVREPADCHDPMLRKVLKGDLGGIRADEARHYLEKKHHFLENYNAGHTED